MIQFTFNDRCLLMISC